jgi:hypothetical protein
MEIYMNCCNTLLFGGGFYFRELLNHGFSHPFLATLLELLLGEIRRDNDCGE